MKKIAIKILFFFFFLNNCFAQPFGGNNAVWHYDFYSVWSNPPYHSPVIVTSVPADTVNGIVFYAITRTDSLAIDCSFVPLTDTVYESNDSVYYYLPSTNRYAMLYNWNALAGDTEVVYVDNLTAEDSIILRIDSVSTISINGFIKRVFHFTNVTPFPQSFYVAGDIIEDIGFSSLLFPQFALCDPLTTWIRCYEDTIIGLYHPWTQGNSCDTVIYLGVEELNFISNISMHPNPTTDIITIHYNLTSQKETTVSLFNLYGQKLKTILNEKQPAGDHEIKMDMKDLDAGFYFVKMIVGGAKEVRKVVKY